MSEDRAEIISNAPEVAFSDVHHARTRELKKGSDLPPSGGSDGIEYVWIRCKQCGWPIDKSKTSPGSGYGNIQAVNAVTTNDDGSTSISTKAKDSEIGAGCPMCGTSEYL